MSALFGEKKNRLLIFLMSGWLSIICGTMLGETNFSGGPSSCPDPMENSQQGRLSLLRAHILPSVFVLLFVYFVSPSAPHAGLEIPSRPEETNNFTFFTGVCKSIERRNALISKQFNSKDFIRHHTAVNNLSIQWEELCS